MSYQESVKRGIEEYLNRVPVDASQPEYIKILVGTSVVQLLAIIADELHEMNGRNIIPIRFIEKWLGKESTNELARAWADYEVKEEWPDSTNEI